MTGRARRTANTQASLARITRLEVFTIASRLYDGRGLQQQQTASVYLDSKIAIFYLERAPEISLFYSFLQNLTRVPFPLFS